MSDNACCYRACQTVIAWIRWIKHENLSVKLVGVNAENMLLGQILCSRCFILLSLLIQNNSSTTPPPGPPPRTSPFLPTTGKLAKYKMFAKVQNKTIYWIKLLNFKQEKQAHRSQYSNYRSYVLLNSKINRIV